MVLCIASGRLISFKRQAGITYMGVMMTLVIAGIGMRGAAVLWQQQMQRSQEALLLEVGEAYRLAIGRYYESTPQAVKDYPKNLTDLVEDKRFPVVKRHLRKLYADPFFPNERLQALMRDGRIIGVYSQSTRKPIRRHGFNEFQTGFASANQYKEWQFIYEPNTLNALEDAW